MRDKNLFPILLGLNAALAIAFVVYLVLSSQRQPNFSTASFPVPEQVTPSQPSVFQEATPPPASNQTVVIPASSQDIVATNVSPAEVEAPPAVRPVAASKTFGWKEVDSDSYQGYLDNLKTVGCPEDKIRYIILSDINDYIAQKRLKLAVDHDTQWWRAEPETSVATLLRDKGLTLEEERRSLISRWLGPAAAEQERGEYLYWNNVQLTGPVLGALPADQHNAVQEVCSESMDRYQNIFWSSINSGQPLNQVDLANLREHTRTELVKILEPDQVEEFLLRYSHNANRLRQELRGFDPTAEEFRQIFRAVDPVDHAMQLEFGSLDSMSTQQRDRYEERRTQAIRDALAPARFQAYLLTKDPLYRQAQMMALQYGAPSSAIMPIYELTKANESRRREIMQDASLSAEEKRQAINAAFLDQQQRVRRIATEAARERTGNP